LRHHHLAQIAALHGVAELLIKTLYKASACSVGFIYLGMPIWHFKFLRFY
jgi:hypothetical protein